jgi:hypothetical protein
MNDQPSHESSEMTPVAPPAIRNDSASPDPRNAPGFLPHLFPSANGAASPPFTADERNNRIVMDFRAAYYEINLRWVRLCELRAQSQIPDFEQRERAALQAIETALRHRDEMEDHYAPFGIIAEPVMQSGVATDIRFTFGSTSATGRFRSQPIVSSANLTFRVPDKNLRCTVTPPGPLPSNATTVP